MEMRNRGKTEKEEKVEEIREEKDLVIPIKEKKKSEITNPIVLEGCSYLFPEETS